MRGQFRGTMQQEPGTKAALAASLCIQQIGDGDEGPNEGAKRLPPYPQHPLRVVGDAEIGELGD